MSCEYCDNTDADVLVEHVVQLDGQGNRTGLETTICIDCYYTGIDLLFHHPTEQVPS